MNYYLTIMQIHYSAPPSPTPAHATPAPIAQAVATDVASSQAVTAATQTTAARNDVHPAGSGEATRVDISFDKRTHAVVFQIVDTQTGKVIVQVPQQAHTDITV